MARVQNNQVHPLEKLLKLRRVIRDDLFVKRDLLPDEDYLLTEIKNRDSSIFTPDGNTNDTVEKEIVSIETIHTNENDRKSDVTDKHPASASPKVHIEAPRRSAKDGDVWVWRGKVLDFKVLNKYKKYDKQTAETEKPKASTPDVTDKKTQDTTPVGFQVRFKYSNAYKALKRQDTEVSRPKIKPFNSKKNNVTRILRRRNMLTKWLPDDVTPQQDEPQLATNSKSRSSRKPSVQAILKRRIKMDEWRTRLPHVKNDAEIENESETSQKFVESETDSEFTSGSVLVTTAYSSSSVSVGSKATSYTTENTDQNSQRRDDNGPICCRSSSQASEMVGENKDLWRLISSDGHLQSQDSSFNLSSTADLSDSLSSLDIRSQGVDGPRSGCDVLNEDDGSDCMSRDGDNESEHAQMQDWTLSTLQQCRYLYQLVGCKSVHDPAKAAPKALKKSKKAGIIRIYNGHDVTTRPCASDPVCACPFCDTEPRKRIHRWLRGVPHGPVLKAFPDSVFPERNKKILALRLSHQ